MPLPRPSQPVARAVFLGGQASEALMPLVRNIIMARLLIPEQFGLAVALSVVMAVVEQCTDFGFDRFVVRHVPGKEQVRRNTIHTLNVLRGLSVALLIALAGPLIAKAVGAPEATWAFAALGLASAFRAFANLGTKEATRDYVYWLDASTLASTQVMWTLLIAGLYFVFGDYRIMLFAIFGAQFTYMVMSHVLSPTPWRLGWDGETAREVLRMGAPLVPNGMILAAKNLGDRLIAATFLGLSAMAIYSAAVMSALMPRGIIQRMMLTLFLPYFVNAGLDKARDSRLFDVYSLMRSMIAAVYSLGFLIVGPPAVAFVFGAQYLPDQPLVDVVSLTIISKLMLGLIVVPALAYGHTSLILISSVGGVVGLGLGTLVVSVTGSLTAMLAGFTAVEFLTVPVIIILATRRLRVPSVGLWVSALVPVALTVAGIAVLHAFPPPSMAVRLGMLLIGLIASAGVFTLALKGLDLSWRHMARVLMRRSAPEPALAEPDPSRA